MRVLICILLFLPVFNSAQNYNCIAKASKTELLIGEATNINVSLKIPANQKIDTVYFKLALNNDSLGNNWELWNSSEVVKKSLQDSKNDYFIQFSKQFTIANFDTGKFEFPPIIAVANKDTSYSNPLLFNIQLKEIDQTTPIKSIKPIKEVPIFWWEYLLYFMKKYTLWIVGILLAIGLVYFFIKRSKKPKILENKKEIIALEIQLLERLENINNKKLWQNGYFKKYYSELSEVLWAFLEHRYKVKTFEKTSVEILESLKWTSISEKYLGDLKRFFTISDSVKFAKSKPQEKDNLHVMDFIRNLISEQRTDLISENNKIESE